MYTPKITKKGVNMCGIAGAAGTPDTNEETQRMLAALEHRGPDACGTYEAKGLSIGNTLLKITGDMPQPQWQSFARSFRCRYGLQNSAP